MYLYSNAEAARKAEAEAKIETVKIKGIHTREVAPTWRGCYSVPREAAKKVSLLVAKKKLLPCGFRGGKAEWPRVRV